MDTNTAYIMAELCSRVYSNVNTITSLFSSSVIGSRAWVFNSSNFIQDSLTGTQAYLVTSGNTVAVVFRGSEVPGIFDLIDGVADIAVSSINDIITGIDTCNSNPTGTGEKLVQLYLQNFDWINDWYTNFSFSLVDGPWTTTIPNVQIHSGFFKAWSNVQSQIESQLTTLIKSLNSNLPITVYITGHSLGAAIATLATVDLVTDVISTFNNISVETFLFGSPFVGNQGFADYYANCMTVSTTMPVAITQNIRNRYDVINVINNALSTMSSYVDVPEGYSTAAMRHSISKYIEEFTLRPVAGYTLPAPVCPPPSPSTAITSLVIRTITSSTFDGTPGNLQFSSQIIPWAVSLIIDPLNNFGGPITINNLSSDQLLPFFLPNQIDTFIISNASAYNLTVEMLQQCILSVTLPAAVSSGVSVSQRVVLDGLQLYINGYDYFTNYHLNASFDELNSSFNFSVPTPYYSIVGRSGTIGNMQSVGESDDGNSWGITNSSSITGIVSSSDIAWNSGLNAFGMGYTTLFAQAVFFPSQTSGGYVVVGGYSIVSNISSSSTFQPLLSWGQSEQSGDNIEYCSEGQAWNPYINATGYAKTYFVSRPIANLTDTLPNLLGCAMMVTSANSQDSFQVAYTWGVTPGASAITGLNNIPSNVAIMSLGDSWNTFSNSFGYQYTFLFFDSDIPTTSTSNTDTSITINIVSIYCDTPSEIVFENNDEIYLANDGSKVWPANSEYSEITAGETLDIGWTFTIAADESTQFDLYDVDTFTSDDLISTFAFSVNTLVYTSVTSPSQQLGECSAGTYILPGLPNKWDRAIYNLTITVS